MVSIEDRRALVSTGPAPRRSLLRADWFHGKKQLASGRLIALVDDDAAFREALCDLLSSFGFEVEAHASAKDVIDSPRLAEYALFLLDVQMPGETGLQLQEKIRALDIHVPTIFVTSCVDAETRARAAALGALAVLGKPFKWEELLGLLRQVL